MVLSDGIKENVYFACMMANTILHGKDEWHKSRGKSAIPSLDDVKEWTGLSSNALWREPCCLETVRKSCSPNIVLLRFHQALWRVPCGLEKL